MTTRWTVATISAVAAAVAAVGVIATATNDDRAAATVPPDSVPGQDDVPGGDRTIVVSGHGTVTVTPDIANLSLGVQTTAPTGSEALDTIGEQSTALVATLKALGIADADLQTSGLSLWPQYSDDGVTINGYTASVNVNVTVRDIARVGEIVDAAQGFVGEGLTIGGIGFSYDEPETVLEDARIAAIENARVRAEQYAAAAGVSLGDIVRIIEPTSQGPVPVFEERFAADESAAGAAVAIEPGSQDLAVDVTVVFAMA